MKKIKINGKMLLILALLCILFLCQNTTVNAASIKKAKPSFIATSCNYNNKYVNLKWTKVKGAKKYEIYRAAVKPSTGKTGKYKKWVTTKKTSIKKASGGDYRYKVRAIKGKQKSKFSATKRIFAASARITKIWNDGNYIRFQVQICNRTSSPMGFLYEWILKNQSKIYLINKTTKKTEGTLNGWLDGGSMYSYNVAREVSANSTQYIQLSTKNVVTAQQYAALSQKYYFLIACSFYPNPKVESVNKQMAIGFTTNINDSAIAGK